MVDGQTGVWHSPWAEVRGSDARMLISWAEIPDGTTGQESDLKECFVSDLPAGSPLVWPSGTDLLISQRHDWINLSGTVGWNIASQQSDNGQQK